MIILVQTELSLSLIVVVISSISHRIRKMGVLTLCRTTISAQYSLVWAVLLSQGISTAFHTQFLKNQSCNVFKLHKTNIFIGIFPEVLYNFVYEDHYLNMQCTAGLIFLCDIFVQCWLKRNNWVDWIILENVWCTILILLTTNYSLPANV